MKSINGLPGTGHGGTIPAWANRSTNSASRSTAASRRSGGGWAVPSDLTLGQLHEVIQIAMGWSECHLHQFVLRDKALKPGRDEARRVAETDAWSDEFINRMRGERVFVSQITPFGEPTEMEGEDEDAVTLSQVCPKVKSKLTYMYDFGDGWEHVIEVQKIEQPKPGEVYPLCLAGKLACPPRRLRRHLRLLPPA